MNYFPAPAGRLLKPMPGDCLGCAFLNLRPETISPTKAIPVGI